MKIKPVKVRYLHLTINCAIPLKKGITDKYAISSVIRIDNNMAFIVSNRLTKRLSISNRVDKRCKKAFATLPGGGIKPLEAVCHSNNVTSACKTTIMINACLLILAKGLKIFFIVVLLNHDSPRLNAAEKNQ